jgi:hypothetical protein
LSSAIGPKAFSFDRKRIVRMSAIALFSIGMISAALMVYQQLQPLETQVTEPSSVPSLLSEADALQLAERETRWHELMIDDYRIEAILAHVKENGYTFVVDEKTVQDTLQIADKMQPDTYSNYYIWKVKLISEEPNRNVGYEREAWINAETGEVLLSAINGSVITE